MEKCGIGSHVAPSQYLLSFLYKSLHILHILLKMLIHAPKIGDFVTNVYKTLLCLITMLVQCAPHTHVLITRLPLITPANRISQVTAAGTWSERPWWACAKSSV